MRADFNPEIADDGLAEDLLIGLIMLGAIGGLAYVGYQYVTDTSTAKTPTKLKVELDKKMFADESKQQQSAWSKDTILWLQKYINRQVLAPRVGNLLGEVEVRFISETGVFDAELSHSLMLWGYFFGGEAGWNLAEDFFRKNYTLRGILTTFGLNPDAVVVNEKLIAGKLIKRNNPTNAPAQKTDSSALVLPDIHLPLKSAGANTIKWVQKYLNTVYKMPAFLAIDGVFGANTRKYLSEYLQSKHFVFGVDYSPNTPSLANNFVNYDLDTLMGGDSVAKSYLSTAL
jgi:hypothetical protein